MSDEKFFEELAQITGSLNFPAELAAPASLQARLYTVLIREQQTSGPLEALPETAASGRKLCVFEQLVTIAPADSSVQPVFYCSVCHAGVLAEHLDNPPIWWLGYPYAQFKNG